MLGRAKESGVATIVARKSVGMRTTGGISATYEYIADVQPDSGAAAFRATFKQHFSGQFGNAGIRRPDVGERAQVTFDPRSQKVELDFSALRDERNAASGPEKTRSTHLRAPRLTAPRHRPAKPAAANVADETPTARAFRGENRTTSLPTDAANPWRTPPLRVEHDERGVTTVAALPLPL